MGAFQDKSRAQVLTNRMRLHYDYQVQAWIRDGMFISCGHRQTNKDGDYQPCFGEGNECYGRAHEGEQHECQATCN